MGSTASAGRDLGLHRSLGLGAGVALAVGSVAGSGILFLPSLTYRIAGRDALLVWAAATLLCFPLLMVFAGMVRRVPDGSGLEGFIALGLGRHVAATVPPLFLSLVCLGLPAGALVAGGYLARAVGGGRPVQLAGALAVLGVAALVNLGGARAGARGQAVLTWVLLGSAVLLLALTFPHAHVGYGAVRPGVREAGPLLSGVVAAFWAYTGFENLTFIAGELRNPRRDFLPATLIALTAYGLLGMALTANVAGVVARDRVDPVTGLAQLAATISPPRLAVWAIAAIALALMQANAASWTWGMSRLLYAHSLSVVDASAGAGRLSGWFARLDGRAVPRRAILALAVVFAAVTCVAVIESRLVVELVLAASTVFMLLYALALISYLRTERRLGRRLLAGALLAFMLAVGAGAGWKALYPLAVFALALGTSLARSRLSRRRVAAR
jgi:amino acid efflux transporter